MKTSSVLAAALCLLLMGCQTLAFKPVAASMSVDVGDDVSVDPQVAWAASSASSSGAAWTIDGFGLNELRFFTGVASGAPLFEIQGVDRKDMGLYNTNMLPGDVAELVASTLAKRGRQQVRTEALRPAPFGSATGFRFDISFTSSDGVLMKGMALFAQRRNKLDMVLFLAPAEYYFDRYAPVVDRIFASVRIPDIPPAVASDR